MKKLLIALLFSVGLQAQTFDFDCAIYPEQFIQDFMDDATAYGHDFSAEVGTMVYNDLPGSVLGSSYGSCSSGYQIEIDEDLMWREYNTAAIYGAGAGDRRIKTLVYHELGHALLERGHVCNTGTPHASGTQSIVGDIMWALSECTFEGSYSYQHPENILVPDLPWVSDAHFEAAAKRMFENTEQRQLRWGNCSYTGKGLPGVIDCY